MAQYPELMTAMKAISARCDGAHALDGQGWSGADSSFGRSLASQSNWSVLQAKSAYRILAKYRKQLEIVGLDYDAIPSPLEQALQESIAAPKRITVEDGEFWVQMPPDWSLNSKIKSIPGRRWEPSRTQWHLPLSSSKQVAAFATEENFEVSPEAQGVFDREIRKYEENLKAATSFDVGDFEVFCKGEPRPYQLAAAKYMVENERCWLTDSVGLGKTLSSLLAVEKTQSYPVLVVCTSSAKISWKRETSRWMGRSAFVIEGKPKKEVLGKIITLLGQDRTKSNASSANKWSFDSLVNESPMGKIGGINDNINLVLQKRGVGDYVDLLNTPDVVIINWDILAHWQDVLANMGFKAIIGDESQKAKEGKSQRTKAFRRLSKDIQYRWLLSATPIKNRMRELWSQIQILGAEKDFGGYNYFAKYYCNATYNAWGLDLSGSAHEEEFNEIAKASGRMVGRKRKDVAKELPDVTRNIAVLPISNRKDYDKAEEDIVNFVGQKALKDKKFREEIAHLPEDEQLQLLKEYKSAKEAAAERAEFFVKINELRQLIERGKLDEVEDWIRTFVENGQKLLVFGEYVATLKELAGRFNAPLIIGETSIKERQEVMDRFQSEDDYLLVFLNTVAGGEAITLTGTKNNPCEHVAFLSLSWSPKTHEQATGRITRLGSTATGFFEWYLIGEDTLDEKNYQMLNDKDVSIAKAIDGHTGNIVPVNTEKALTEYFSRDSK